MKLDSRYEVHLVVANVLDDPAYINSYGDIYDNYNDICRDYPHSEYKYGFVVVDTQTGFVAEGCNDWNDTPEDAIRDYKEHLKAENGCCCAVTRELRCNNKVFFIGDKVRLTMREGYPLSIGAPKGFRYVGTITHIIESRVGMEYFNGVDDYPYLQRGLPPEQHSYNESGFFKPEDIIDIELISRGGDKQ